MRKIKFKLSENMSELADVENKDLGVVDNVYAAAIRDFRKTKKQKEDAVKVQDAEKLNETPKKPEMNKGAKQMKLEKLMLEESLFIEDADEVKTLIGQILEFPNGDYLTIDFKDGKLIAGNATNAGVIPEFEIEYDDDFSADWNLQVLYDVIIEQKPELLGRYADEYLKERDTKQESIKTRKGIRRINSLKENSQVYWTEFDVDDLEEAYTHFTYKSGANPYIAKTDKEAQRILNKYKGKVKETKKGFYEIDDTKEDAFIRELKEDKELDKEVSAIRRDMTRVGMSPKKNRDEHKKFLAKFKEKRKEVKESKAESEYVIDNVGIREGTLDGDEIEGTVYGHEGDEEYFDTIKFKVDKDNKDIVLTYINPIFTEEEKEKIKDILLDNIKTNFKESLKEDYEKETLESCKDGFGNEIKAGDTIVGIDYYKDITVGKIVEITKEYGDITMVNFDDGKHSFISGLINTAVYKFDKKYGYIYGYKDSKLEPTLTDKREDISDALASFSEWSADMYGQGGEKVFKAFDKNGEILFDELSENLEESKQLNEGAGAGYTIEGELHDIVVNKINGIKIHDGETAFGTPTQFAEIDLDADALFDGYAESYYYGDRIDDAKVKITSLNVNPNLIYDLGLKEFEYDKIELQDLNDRLGFGSTLKFKSDVIGGGWSHLPFDGKAKSTRVDDDYMSYIDGIEFTFVEPSDIEFIDKAVLGETEIEETDIEEE